MNFVKQLAVGVMLLAALATTASASIVQSTAPANSDSYYYGNGWNHQSLGSVVLAAGTNRILDLTSTVTLWDQGWGGQTYDNGVKISLDVNGTDIWTQAVAGAYHGSTTQTFNILTQPSILSALNVAINGIDWSLAPMVNVEMYTTPYAWGGWELHTRNASFSVTSATVPEPTSALLLALGLFGVIASRRKIFRMR